ncbi:RdRP-domain-containing protein [Hortaea werneckii]|nr:RdRP-domain-containing protein [Hortaea werneckii]KAI7593406.1 RdRP-domain-containing protein [Hortaea werneckii]
MADIECQLLAEVDRVVSSPYPTQLKLINVASIHILRDALLRQAPGLLHELAELAIKTENARSKYTRATVSVLSHPLPENVALPASVQCLFLRLVDNAAEHPSTATVKPLNMMLSGTSTQLLGLLPNDVLLRFEKQMLGILYSSVQKPNQEMDQHLTLRCLFAISVVVKGADDRLMLTNSFYETQELLASTQQDSSRWNANEMRKFFLDGESVPKTIRLLVLQALSACSSSGGSLDERAEGLAHVNDLVAVIPQNLRDNWCAANGQMIQKFQAKAVAAEHGELRLQLLSFVCQLCKPVFLQLATVESIQNTVSDLDLLLSANVAADASAWDKDKLENASAAAKKQEELEDLQESHQELERDAEIRSQELTDLRQSTRAANAVKDDLQRRLDEACRGIENKSAEVEDLRMSSESHASVSSKLKSDLDAVIQQSEQQRQSHEQSIQRLKEENRQNQQSVNAAHNETMDKLAAQHGEEAARYESELSSVKEALATTRTQYTEELARRRDGMDDAQSQIDRLLQKCKQKDQQIADANAMRANLMAAMGIAPAAEATQMSSLPHRSRKSIHRAPSRPYDRLDQSSPHPVSGGGGETRDYNEQDPTAPNDLMEKGPTPKRPRSRRSLKVQSPVRPRSSMNTRNSRMSAPGKASANRQPLSNVSTNQSPKKPARTRSSKFEAKEIGNEFDETTLDGNEMIGHGTSAQMEMDMDLSSMLADDMQQDKSTDSNTTSQHTSPARTQYRRQSRSTFPRSRAVRHIQAQKKALSGTLSRKMSIAVHQRESHGRPRPETRPVLQRTRVQPVLKPVISHYADLPDLKVKLLRIPDDWGTLQIHNHLSGYGSIDLIEVNEATRARPRSAYVIFKPPPSDESWVNANLVVKDNDGNRHSVKCVVDDWKHEQIRQANAPSPVEGSLAEFSAGIMQQEDRMLMLFTAAQSSGGSQRVIANHNLNRLEVCFSLCMDTDQPEVVCHYKLLINFAQVKQASLSPSNHGRILVFTVEKPPLLFRRASTVQETHERDSLYWRESQLWYRQTGIGIRPDLKDQMTQLQKEDAILDLGRWLTYRLAFGNDDTEALDSISQALISHNIDLKPAMTNFVSAKSEELWSWNADNQHADGHAHGFRGSLAMHLMSPSPVRLAFKVRYQLEVCLSIGVLNESNMTAEFIQKLAETRPENAERMAKVLEMIADNEKRIYDPMEIFRLQGLVNVSTKKMPRYCAMVPGAVVTPSTIYFSTPVVETSNRVIRKYAENGDRFLRVKFTDERYRGKIKAGDDKTMSEVLTRIYRTMKNGIKIGDRLYEFLAFGNAQFREHGAYFFAPTHSLTASKMRQWMGDFSEINVVAKYASRIGQCFSTTRAVSLPVTLETIPDIMHNGYCFTDGVGKISHFLARMIAEEHMMPHSDEIYPSVFQFRLGGCKGVLAVDPSLPSGTIHVRPSQQKFPAKYKGLEICRISQYSSANLNVQIILVLNALGVKSWAFQIKMQKALDDILAAMTDQYKAIEQLSRNVDSSQTTLILADMIFDGFMDANDPFMISCLRLWRAWMLKYLKEKARIPVEQGAFVLGCVDETATLKGHRDEHLSTDSSLLDQAQLPEIFLQISDPDHKGRYKIIEGVCVLTRNPSLHPGDARVVRAVDVEALHHLKNCVVLPQTGDRDLASMCSGGDLDGDDYLVIWDTVLVPSEWNYPPMDYAAPEPVRSKGPVTVGDMTVFYVQHMKHDNLGRIAMAHRYHADDSDDGVKDPKCLELAQLHSLAVDYAKTGKPAEFPRRLRVRRHPHWAEPGKRLTYHSKKVLGKLYDMVQRQDPEPAWGLPFDQRVLDRHSPSEQMLQDAREVKQQYDEAIRRVMAQHGIQRELEVWTTFVLKHNDDVNDYKFVETLSETISALKDCYRELCFEKAGTTKQELDWSKLSAFIVAMYAVTAEETKSWRLRKEQGVDSFHAADQPYISFPWIFAKELGYIAKGRSPGAYAFQRMNETRPSQRKQPRMLAISQDQLPPQLSVVNNNGEERILRGGDVLNFSQAESTPTSVRSASADGIGERDANVSENATSSTSGGQKTAEGTPPESTGDESSAASQTDIAASQAAPHTTWVPAVRPAAEDPAVSDAGQGSEVVEEEEVFLQSAGVSSALGALDALMGT